eukprot:snap_masked-scaffold_39-processed-gene-2.38-mRNA-1 protein AED:1.00 eAED:1.00 QI:0/0/0/0/1/1/2/0/126
MTQDKDIGNLVLTGKNNFIQWKEFISLEAVFTKDIPGTNIEVESNTSTGSSMKEKKAKVLTIVRKYLDINLHYLIHGIRKPSEVFGVIEKYCIGNKKEKLMTLDDSLNNPEGRYSLEKLKNFNTAY